MSTHAELTLTRFAPAPTGHLHLGHVVNALYVWRLARAHGARVLLRIEDHDRQRCRPEYEAALLDDLDWLGFTPDLCRTDELRAGVCDSRQSNRQAVYEAQAAALIERGLVYGCRCSRRQVAAAAPASLDGSETPYPGTCRHLGLRPENGLAWRLRIVPGVETFRDMILGPQEQNPAAQCGDVVIRDRLGNWTYQFVVSVDDFLQGVDLVIRGKDLLSSTGRQIQLARLIGRPTPATFAHHALVMKSADQKLSKADADTGIRDLRARGWTVSDVLAEAERFIALQPPTSNL